MSKKIAIILLLATVPSIYQLIKPGFYEPHDLHHLADIYQMARAVSSGQIPPRLGPDFTFGYGYPLFNFYYLLPFYLGAFLYALFGSLTASFESIFVVSAILSVFGMYLFLREFFGQLPSFVGSLLFLYTPYRAVQIYVRGAMGEALALSLLPFVLWGITRTIKEPKNRKLVVATAILSGLLIISHNYLWIMTVPFVLLLLLFLKRVEKNFSSRNLLFTGLVSLGLTAYWWIPALVENKLVSSTTPFPLIDHFPFVKQLIIPSWGYGSSVWGPGDELSFQIGVVNLAVVGLLVGIGIYRFIRHPELVSGTPLKKILNLVQNDKRILLAIWALIAFFVSVFFMNIRSLFLWKLIPFHDFIQFPWRLLIFTTFFSSILAAFFVHTLPKKISKFVGLAIIVSSLMLTIQYFTPSSVFYREDEDYLKLFFEDSSYSEDYLLLPKWVEERPEHSPLTKISIADGELLDIQKINSVNWISNINAKKSTKVTFHSYYFPGWNASVDGKNADIFPGKPYGQIELNVDEGIHKVEFYWKETNLRKISDYISLLSLLYLGFLAGSKKIKIA